MRTMQLAGIRYARAAAAEKHAAAVRTWEAQYPADPSRLIARRLRAFLDVSAEVDYTATLESRGGAMRFTNAAYESKSSEWKLCYRAGKETVDAARESAARWLNELESGADNSDRPGSRTSASRDR
jgi:hypothetical protein